MNDSQPPPRRPHPLERPPAAPPPEPPPPRRVVSIPTTRPLLTYVLLGVIVLVYGAQQVASAQQGNPFMIDPLTARFMKINPSIVHEGEYYRLFTAMFLHGSIAHLFFNGYALYVIGQTVERFFGRERFALIFFLGGLSGSLASLVFTPSASLGASGAIFALLGAEGVFFFQHRHLFGDFGRSRFGNILFVAIINLVLGFAPGTGIDNWGHVGGLFGGLVLAWFIGPRLGLQQTALNGVVEVVDENPFQRSWTSALLYAGGLLVMTIFAIVGLG